MEICLPAGEFIQGTLYFLREAGQQRQRLPFCLNLLHMLCSAGFLKGGEVAPPEHAPHVWGSAWDWPGMQWPTEVWGIWKKAEKRVGNMLESRNWPTAKSRSLKKKKFSPDSEISYASHSTQVEPEISSSRKQDERKIPSYQGHSEQKDFLPTLNLKCWSAALSFPLLKTLFFLLYYFCFLTKHNFKD